MAYVIPRCSYTHHSLTHDLQMFHGDLDFYFGGWDGRSRVASIDTNACPVYMLTGEYDWSNTPEMSQKTADKIKGAKHKAMPKLGHFPATVSVKCAHGKQWLI
jgi:pimeloyl-ACP methyl ester carboxylesterase